MNEQHNGFIWWIFPTSNEARIYDPETCQDYGYHGTDVDPCITPAEYLADGNGLDSTKPGFLVLTERNEPPELVEGWKAKKIALKKWLNQ